MKKEQIEVMEDIARIEKNQGLLLDRPKSVQQQLFQLYGQRHLLKQKMMHRQLDQVLEFLPGTFAHTALSTLYLSTCLEMKLQISYEDLPLLKILVNWSESFPQQKEKDKFSFVELVTPMETILFLKGFEEYITYLNFISSDLIKLIARGKDADKSTRVNYDHIKAQDLLQFLINSLPKVLFNIILPVDVLPPQYRNNSMQVLYRSTAIEYFTRTKSSYAALMKLLIKILFKLQLKPGQQRTMMEIVFRYFYCYHFDKKYGATDIFIEAFNLVSQSVRFAMADQFVLFFRVVQKIGKVKFCQFLMQKSEWIRDIYNKVSLGNMVGYAKQALSPFPTMLIADAIQIANGKKEHRTVEIFEDYSLLYFSMNIPAYDVTIRLNYLGELNATSSTCVELLCYEKQSGFLKGNIMASKKGIYQFQFDNSYSWMNKKLVRMEKMVMAPLQFKSEGTPSWIGAYFDQVPLNKLKDQSKLNVIHKKQVQPPKQQPETHDGVANISKDGSFLTLKVRRRENIYQFQTESEERLVKKFQQIIDLGGKIKWMVAGQPLEEPERLKEMLSRNEERHSEQKGQKKVEQRDNAQKEPIKMEEKPKEKSQVQEGKVPKKVQKEAKQ